ncbi:MAG: hypothetical protein HY362_00735 [Candidatus Aenigmarchaeota archaeon]|nr:hypothetical protein [Candidatus Aenigmarchaeota archaeon]
MSTYELLVDKKPVSAALPATMMKIENISLQVSPKEKWDEDEQRKFEDVSISVFELSVSDSPQPPAFIRSREQLARRVASIGPEGVDMGELTGLIHEGKKEFSTAPNENKVYDMFVMGKSRSGIRNRVGFMRWSKESYGNSPLLNVEEAKYLVLESLGIEQKSVSGVRAQVGIARMRYPNGVVFPGICFAYDNNRHSGLSLFSYSLLNANCLLDGRIAHSSRHMLPSPPQLAA